MNTFSWANGVRVDAFFKCANCVGPHAGGVDDNMSANIKVLTITRN